jgi:hypothetical protein
MARRHGQSPGPREKSRGEAGSRTPRLVPSATPLGAGAAPVPTVFGALLPASNQGRALGYPAGPGVRGFRSRSGALERECRQADENNCGDAGANQREDSVADEHKDVPHVLCHVKYSSRNNLKMVNHVSALAMRPMRYLTAILNLLNVSSPSLAECTNSGFAEHFSRVPGSRPSGFFRERASPQHDRRRDAHVGNVSLTLQCGAGPRHGPQHMCRFPGSWAVGNNSPVPTDIQASVLATFGRLLSQALRCPREPVKTAHRSASQ